MCHDIYSVLSWKKTKDGVIHKDCVNWAIQNGGQRNFIFFLTVSEMEKEREADNYNLVSKVFEHKLDVLSQKKIKILLFCKVGTSITHT